MEQVNWEMAKMKCVLIIYKGGAMYCSYHRWAIYTTCDKLPCGPILAIGFNTALGIYRGYKLHVLASQIS